MPDDGPAACAGWSPRLERRLYQILLSQSTFKVGLWATLLTVVCSLAVTVVMNLAISPPPTPVWLTYTLSICTPLLISPPMVWLVMRLMMQIDTARRTAERLAITDPLTGACNRRHFFRVGEHVLKLGAADGMVLSVLLLDIDHFKSVNDVHGHAVGDQVLVAVARACTGALREGDLLARFGGEEFVVLLPYAPAPDALRLAERLRLAVAGLAVEHGGATAAVHPTVSVGVASARAGTASLDPLIARADVAMYAAKHGGRNRAVAAED